MDLRDDAVPAVAAEFLLDPPGFLRSFRSKLKRERNIWNGEQDLTRAAQCVETHGQKVPRPILRRDTPLDGRIHRRQWRLGTRSEVPSDLNKNCLHAGSEIQTFKQDR